MSAGGIEIRIDPNPPADAFARLWQAAWDAPWTGDLDAIRAHSLAHLGAYDGAQLIGYVNLAGDGDIHAFILDTSVHPDYRRRGVGSALVRAAVELARRHGVTWLHVDYEPRHEAFYRGCGFRPTAAGLLQLR